MKNSATQKIKETCRNHFLWLGKVNWQVFMQVWKVKHCHLERIKLWMFPQARVAHLSKWGRKPWRKSSLFWKKSKVWIVAISIKWCWHHLLPVPTPCQPTTNSSNLNASLSKVHPLLVLGFLYKQELIPCLSMRSVKPLVLLLCNWELFYERIKD